MYTLFKLFDNTVEHVIIVVGIRVRLEHKNYIDMCT
jgi:hypothetical protein